MYFFAESASEMIGLEEGLQDILTAMKSFPESVELSTVCCNALWSLTVNGTFNHFLSVKIKIML